jgi:hypothetical protein
MHAPATSATAADAAEHAHFGANGTVPEAGAPLETTGALEPLEPSERIVEHRAPPEAVVDRPMDDETDDVAEPPDSADLGIPFLEPLAGREPLPAVDHGAPEEPIVEPRFARLGADGLRRLRERYADLVSRLQLKPEMPEAEREDLTARVARLDPDRWIDDAAVAHALEDYEAVYESIRPFLGRPPRRRRL